MRRFRICVLLLIIVLCFMGCGLGSNYQKKLPGSWYAEGSSSASFILYDDGTCEIAGEYGTGSWSIVNNNELKMTNYYGETETGTIKSVDGDKLVLTNGDRESVFYSHP